MAATRTVAEEAVATLVAASPRPQRLLQQAHLVTPRRLAYERKLTTHSTRPT